MAHPLIAGDLSISVFDMDPTVSNSSSIGQQPNRQDEGPETTESATKLLSSTRFAAAINEFAEETGVFGLSLLRTGRSHLENAFWIVCTLFFTFCTVRDLAALTISYLSQETLSLTTQMTNTTITLDPAPTLCFMHGFPTLDFRNLSSQDAQDALIDNFLDMFENNSDHDVAAKTVDDDFFKLMLAMLSGGVTQEIRTILPALSNQSDTALEWANKYKAKENYQLIQSSIAHMYKRFSARNINFSRLLKFAALQLCVKAAFTSEVRLYLVGKRVGSPCTMMSMLGMDSSYLMLRFRNLKAPFAFSELSDYALLSWNGSGKETVFVDVGGTPQTIWERENSILTADYTKPGQRLVASLGIVAAFVRTEEKTSQPCSSTIARYDCKQRCYISRFIDQCQCYPIYFTPAYPPTSRDIEACPYGGRENQAARMVDGVFDYLASCRKINTSEEETLNAYCNSACLPDCRTLTFVTTIEQETLLNETRNELKLKIQSFTFPLIEEKLALNFQGFISQFGGILGLYIGISFAGLVHVPVFAIRKVVEHMRRRSTSRKRTVRVADVHSDESVVAMSSAQCVEGLTGRECRQWFHEILMRFDDVDSRFLKLEKAVNVLNRK